MAFWDYRTILLRIRTFIRPHFSNKIDYDLLFYFSFDFDKKLEQKFNGNIAEY
jgi:hypothetical protein